MARGTCVDKIVICNVQGSTIVPWGLCKQHHIQYFMQSKNECINEQTVYMRACLYRKNPL